MERKSKAIVGSILLAMLLAGNALAQPSPIHMPEGYIPSPPPNFPAPHARNWWPDSYIVQVTSGVSQQTDTDTRRDMLKLITSSPVLNAKNVEQVAVDYLKENLTTETAVFGWDLNDPKEIPEGPWHTLLKVDYTAWPQEVNGKDVIVGALSVQRNQSFRKGEYCFGGGDDVYEMPVETFILSDDKERASKNLRIAIARLLERFANLRKPNENHTQPYAPPRAPVQ